MSAEQLAVILATAIAREWPQLARSATYLRDVLAIASALADALAAEPPVRIEAPVVIVEDRRA